MMGRVLDGSTEDLRMRYTHMFPDFDRLEKNKNYIWKKLNIRSEVVEG